MSISWTNGACLYLCPVESATNVDCQVATRTSIGSIDHAMVTSSNLAPNPTVNRTTSYTQGPTPSGTSTARYKHQSPARESTLVASSMEHKVRRLEEAGVIENATDVIIRANPRRYLRYAQVQAKHFVGRDLQMDFQQAITDLKFLADGYTTHR